MGRRQKKTSGWKQGFTMGGITFFLAIFFNFFSRNMIQDMPLGIAFLILILIIFIGVFFDIIGIAVTAANLVPFNAMCARRVYGSREVVLLLQKRDRVATFCNDIIGDICGTISGVTGAVLIIRSLSLYPSWNEVAVNMVVVGSIAALTVGGKASGKKIAIQYADDIMLKVGQTIYCSKQIFFWRKREKARD